METIWEDCLFPRGFGISPLGMFNQKFSVEFISGITWIQRRTKLLTFCLTPRVLLNVLLTEETQLFTCPMGTLIKRSTLLPKGGDTDFC